MLRFDNYLKLHKVIYKLPAFRRKQNIFVRDAFLESVSIPLKSKGIPETCCCLFREGRQSSLVLWNRFKMRVIATVKLKFSQRDEKYSPCLSSFYWNLIHFHLILFQTSLRHSELCSSLGELGIVSSRQFAGQASWKQIACSKKICLGPETTNVLFASSSGRLFHSLDLYVFLVKD